MSTRNTLLTGLILAFFVFSGNAQSQHLASSSTLALPTVYGLQGNTTAADAKVETKEDYLPYAEPILGLSKEEYQEHFEEYRSGSLMDRVMDLNEMELQAIYADSKMQEINVSFNARTSQDLVVNIYDQYGKKVFTEMKPLTEGINNYKISTENLSDGFYSMVVIGNNEQFIQRFIIE